MDDLGASNSEAAADLDRRFQMFKFYEDAVQRTKADAWTQTTWILTLSGAVLGFSMNLYVTHRDISGFPVIAGACAASGLVLTAYAAHVLRELAKHIQGYWTSANGLAASHPMLKGYIPVKDADSVARLGSDYRAGYPKFIARLLLPVLFFAAGHVAWGLYAST